MEETRVRLVERIKRTPTVESFRFMPQEEIGFAAGQFSQIIFDEGDRNNKELNKYLSFSSSPTKEYIEVSKRLSDSKFSQKLRGLAIGVEVLFKTPMGNCVFKEDYRKIGFLIGGIGITPVISIIEYIVDKGLNTDVCLVYSNRTEEEIAFRKELDNWKALNKNLKISYVVSECEPKDKTCIFGRVDQGLIKKLVCDINDRIMFIFGPPKMVEAMNGLCLDLNCAKDNVKIENFVGY